MAQSRASRERAAVYGLVAAMAIAAATVLYLGRNLAFWNDELGWLVFGDDFAPESLLTPHNGHLIALPRFVYELLPRLFGPEYLPFRLVGLATFLTCVGLFFLIARRYVGGPIALAPSIVLLFFGSADELVLSPLGIPFTLSIAFGLGALLALQEERRHDLLASALLILSLLSHSFGGLVAVGVVLHLSIKGADRRRRLWVPLVPLALYAGWWIWAQKFDQGIASVSNIAEVPAFVAEAAAATLAALTGFAGPTPGGGLSAFADVAEVLFVVAAAAALIYLALRLRERPMGPWLGPYLLILLVYWVGLGLSDKVPTRERYLFFGSIMVLLIVAARARGVRPTRSAVAVLLAFCSVSLVLNFAHLVRSAERFEASAAEIQAQLGVLEMAGEGVNPAFVPRESGLPVSRTVVPISSGRYLKFVDAIGPLGFTGPELARQPGSVRARADLVLSRAQGLTTVSDLPIPSDSVGLPSQRQAGGRPRALQSGRRADGAAAGGAGSRAAPRAWSLRHPDGFGRRSRRGVLRGCSGSRRPCTRDMDRGGTGFG